MERIFYKFCRAIDGFCLGLHYKGVNSYVFINGVEIHKLKAKDSEINAYLLCLDNV